MANNQISLSVYKINSRDGIPLNQVQPIGFPTQGVLLRTVTNEENNTPGDLVISNGIRVYGAIQLVATGDTYYVTQTQAQLITLFNA